MRTTIRLPDDLLAQTKRLAADRQRTLTSVIEDALRDVLARHAEGMRDQPAVLQTFGGTGVARGIDLDDSAGLLERMESGNDSDGR